MAPGGDRDGKNTESAAAGHIMRCVADDDDLVAGERAARIGPRSFDGNGRKAGPLLTVGSERAKAKELVYPTGLQLQAGTLRDIAGQQGDTHIRVTLQLLEQRDYARVQPGLVPWYSQLGSESTQVGSPERFQAAVDGRIW